MGAFDELNPKRCELAGHVRDLTAGWRIIGCTNICGKPGRSPIFALAQCGCHRNLIQWNNVQSR